MWYWCDTSFFEFLHNQKGEHAHSEHTKLDTELDMYKYLDTEYLHVDIATDLDMDYFYTWKNIWVQTDTDHAHEKSPAPNGHKPCACFGIFEAICMGHAHG